MPIIHATARMIIMITASLTEHKNCQALLSFFSFLSCGFATLVILPYCNIFFFIQAHLPLLIAARLLSFVRSVLNSNYLVKNTMLFTTFLNCRRQDEKFNSSVLPLTFFLFIGGDWPVWTITCYVYPFLIYFFFTNKILQNTQRSSCR